MISMAIDDIEAESRRVIDKIYSRSAQDFQVTTLLFTQEGLHDLVQVHTHDL